MAAPKSSSKPPVKARATAAKKAVATKVAAPRKAPRAKAPAPKPEKVKRKLVRDSFTIPQADVDLIGKLKERALGFKRPTKKSELLRAGLHALARLDEAKLRALLEALPQLKPGRPKRGE